MSADNGIYVLKSPVHEDMPGELEFRVTHAMAIDNITYEPDRDGFNTRVLIRYFGRCVVIRDRTEALVEADRLAQYYVILEYGIQFINLPFPFPD